MNYVRNTFFSLALLLVIAPSAFAGGTDPVPTPTPAPADVKVAADWKARVKAAPSEAFAWMNDHRKTTAAATAALLVGTTGLVWKYNKAAGEKLDKAYAKTKDFVKSTWTAYKASKVAQGVSAVAGLAGASYVAYTGYKNSWVSRFGTWTGIKKSEKATA